MNENGKLGAYIDTVYLALGEIAVSAIINIVCLIFGWWDYKILTGTIVGSAVITLNMLILSVSVNKAINKYIELRGEKEMTEEEAEEFAKKHSMDVQNAMTKSYLLRTFLMLGSLILALITGWFNVVSTLLPLLMYRPLMYIIEIIKRKRGV